MFLLSWIGFEQLYFSLLNIMSYGCFGKFSVIYMVSEEDFVIPPS